MSSTPPEPTVSGPVMGRVLRWVILTLVGVGVGWALYVITLSSFKPAEDGLAQFRRASLHRLDVPARPRPAPTARVVDAQGQPIPLAQPGASLTLVNLWATWCAPCRTEMPTLAAVQREYAARGLVVRAVSLDRPQEQAAARAFIATQAPLTYATDPTMGLFHALQPRALGLPVTLILDSRGRERARVVGDADWSSPEARGLIERLLSERAPPPARGPGTP